MLLETAYWIFGVGALFFWPLIIVGLVVFFLRYRGKRSHPAGDKEWYLRLALSKEDAVSQLFLLLGVIFFGATLLALDGNLDYPLSWKALIFITSVFGLLVAYYFKAIYPLILGLVGFALWWGVQAAGWVQEKNLRSSAVFAGLSFLVLSYYALGHVHEREEKYKRFAMVYLLLGIIPITVVLFFFSTKPGLAVFERMTRGVSFLGSWQVIVSLLGFLALLIGATLYSVGKKLMSVYEILAVGFLVFLFGAMALLPEQSLFLQTGTAYGFYSGLRFTQIGVGWAILFNVLVFFELLGLILLGYLRRETWLINLGAVFLFLLVLAKYFDWFFAFLDKSVFFIGAGILLFVVGWFMEKGRRYMVSDVKVQRVSSEPASE